MTFTCTDPACECVAHQVDPFDHGMVPVCPHCRESLYDQVGEPLEPDAVRGWCYARHWHVGVATISHDYNRESWDWRRRRDIEALYPLSEQRELAAAAAADPTDPPIEDTHG